MIEQSGTRERIDFEGVRAHFDAYRYMSGYRASMQHWSETALVEEMEPAQITIAARLARHLGNGKVGRWLVRTGRTRYPDDEGLALYELFYGIRNEHPLDTLRGLDSGDNGRTYKDPLLQSNWLASMAVHWASYRDPARAHRLLEAAESIGEDPGYTAIARASVLQLEDRLDEALLAGEAAFEQCPARPSAVAALGRLLSRAGRVEEAARRILEVSQSGESFEIALEAVRYCMSAAEHQGVTRQTEWLERAAEASRQVPELAPLADRATRRLIDYMRFDVAHLRRDDETLREIQENGATPYVRSLADQVLTASSRQVHVLPIEPLRQKHNTCLPTAVGSILAGRNEPIDVDALVREVSYGGTSTWRAVAWLEKQGYVAQPVLLNRAVAEALLEGGQAFVFITSSLEGAHAMTAFGLDRGSDCLLVHDPSGLRWAYYDLEHFTDIEAPLGPEGIVIVRPEDWEAAKSLAPAENFEVARLQNEYYRLLETAGVASAGKVAEEVEKRFPRHPVAWYIRGIHLRNSGRSREAIRILGELLKRYPRCERLQAAVASVHGSAGDTARERAVLKDIVEHDRLPGLQLEQEWRRPPIPFVTQYALLLARSDDKLPEALRLMRRAVSWNPFAARGWHGLGSVLERMGDRDAAVLPLRVAASLEAEDDYYARQLMGVLASLHREDEGFSALRERAERLCDAERGGEAWCALVGAYEAFGHPDKAANVLEQAVRQHPTHEILLSFAARFWCDMGTWDRAHWAVKQLKKNGQSLQFLEAAAYYAMRRGDRAGARKYGSAWLEEFPLSEEARRFMLMVTTMEQGQAAGISLVQSWLKQQPDNETLERMLLDLYERVRDEDTGDALVAGALRRDPDDAWAWREKGLRLLSKMRRAPVADRPAMERELAETVAECARTCPEHPVTLVIQARQAELRGNGRECVDLYVAALERDPSLLVHVADVGSAMQRLPKEERWPVVERLEKLLLQMTGSLSGALELALQIGEYFGLEEAEKAAARWRDRHGESAQITEALGCLLLVYGHGQPDIRRALELLTEGVRRFPAHPELQHLLARCHGALGDGPAEEAVWRELMERSPADLRPRFRLARMLDLRGDTERALPLLESCLAIQPADPIALERHAVFLWDQSRAGESIAALEKGLNLVPESIELRELLAGYYMSTGKEHEALRVLRDGLERMPRVAYLWALYGQMMERSAQLHDHREIEKVYRRALKLDATLVDASDALAVLLSRNQRYDDAKAILEAQQPLLQNDVSLRGRLAWIRYEQGDHRGGMQALQKALDDEPRYGWGWRTLIGWVEDNRNLELAREILPKVHAAFPEDAYLRGYALETLARLEPGVDRYVSDWEQLLADFPQDHSLYLMRFDMRYDAEDFAGAREVLDRIDRHFPGSPYVRARDVYLSLAERNPDRALAAARQVWEHPAPESEWPEDTAWRALHDAGLGERALATCRASLDANVQIGKVSFGWMCGYVAHAYWDFWAPVRVIGRKQSPSLSVWLPGKPARALLSFLRALDDVSWDADEYRAVVLSTLLEGGYGRMVYRWYKKNKRRADASPALWEIAGFALVRCWPKYKYMRDYFATWRERPGLDLCCAMLYVTGVYNAHPWRSNRTKLHEQVRWNAQEALEHLKHDHTARYMVCMLGASLLQLGRWDEFLQCIERYGPYIREQKDSEDVFTTDEMLRVPTVLESFHSLLTMKHPSQATVEALSNSLAPAMIRRACPGWVSPTWHRCIAERYPGVAFNRRIWWWLRRYFTV